MAGRTPAAGQQWNCRRKLRIIQPPMIVRSALAWFVILQPALARVAGDFRPEPVAPQAPVCGGGVGIMTCGGMGCCMWVCIGIQTPGLIQCCRCPTTPSPSPSQPMLLVKTEQRRAACEPVARRQPGAFETTPRQARRANPRPADERASRPSVHSILCVWLI